MLGHTDRTMANVKNSISQSQRSTTTKNSINSYDALIKLRRSQSPPPKSNFPKKNKYILTVPLQIWRSELKSCKNEISAMKSTLIYVLVLVVMWVGEDVYIYLITAELFLIDFQKKTYRDCIRKKIKKKVL